MEFNPSKCEFLRITNKKKPIVFNYCIEGAPIVQVSHTKYLGVTISNNLSWNIHVQCTTNKAKQVNNCLYRNLWECPSHIKNNCYKIMVCPIIEYAASVWDPHTLLNINKLGELLLDSVLMIFQGIQAFLTCCPLSIYHCYQGSETRKNPVRDCTILKDCKIVNVIQ